MIFLKRWYLFPFRLIFQAIAVLRNALFDRGLLRIDSFEVPVISIGNLSVGGTGKTPVIMYLLDRFADSFQKVAVVTRGYGRKSSGQVIVSDGAGNICSAEKGGDEPVLIATRYPQSVVIANAKRSSGIRFATKHFGCDLILLDDAFQHRYVQRDCNIVLLNATADREEYIPLPQGRLREPLKNISRADIVLITKGNGIQQRKIKDLISKYYEGPLYPAEFKTDQLLGADFNPVFSLIELRNQQVTAFCGIADADNFFETLKKSGILVQKFIRYADHHFYSQANLISIKNEARTAGCRTIITTEKDLIRINPTEFADFQLFASRVDVRISDHFTENVRTFIDKGISN